MVGGIHKEANRVYDVDVTSILNDKAEFFTLSIGCPPCERSLKYDARVLGLEDVPAAKAVIREGRRFTTLPQEDVKEFLELRSRARRTFLSYSMSFPFLPPGVVPIPKDRIPAMWSDMNDAYIEFNAAKAKLIEKLAGLKAARMGEYLAAGHGVWSARHPKGPDGKPIERDDFLGLWSKVFERWFPTAADIDREYFFDLRSVGTIRKTISIMTREEFLKDEETAAKSRVIADGEKKLREEFTDWIAAVALNSRVNLLKALRPVVDGMKDGHSVGKAEIARIEKHVTAIRNMDVFGDASFESMVKMVSDATATLKLDVDKMDKLEAEMALSSALNQTEKALQSLEFNPNNFRKLELDGDAPASEVFADADFMAEITEKMNAQLADAVKELGEKAGGTDEEKRDAEKRIALAVKLKAIAAEAPAGAVDTALRAGTIELDDDENGAAPDNTYAFAGGLEIGDGDAAPADGPGG